MYLNNNFSLKKPMANELHSPRKRPTKYRTAKFNVACNDSVEQRLRNTSLWFKISNKYIVARKYISTSRNRGQRNSSNAQETKFNEKLGVLGPSGRFVNFVRVVNVSERA